MSGVNLLFGPLLIGVFLNCILYGILVVQTLVYFQTHKSRDALWLKTFVAYLMFCETVNTACDIYLIYEPLIIRYGTERAVTVAPIMLSADPVLTVMVSTPVQLFIAWRVKITSRSAIVPAIISFFSIMSFVGGIATAISVTIINKYADFHKFEGGPIAWLASSTAADILITTALVYNLSRQRTGFAVTDDLINRIIRLTVQTGMVTSVFAALDITLFLVTKAKYDIISILFFRNFIWDLPLSKLYSNSLLSTLNARGGWKATSTVRSNVLFGHGTEVESAPRSRPQIEFVNVDPAGVAGHPANLVPMKAFDSDPEVGYHDQDPAGYTQKFTHAV